MRTFPTSADVQGATYYYYPGRQIHYNLKTALTVHNFHSQRSIPCWAAYHGITGKYILNISFESYWVPIYTPGLRAAMWINCLAVGQKCRAIAGIEPGLSTRESSEHTMFLFIIICFTCYYCREFVTYKAHRPTVGHCTVYFAICKAHALYNTISRHTVYGSRHHGQRLAGQSQCKNFPLVILITVSLTGSNLWGSPVIYSNLCFLMFLQFVGWFFSNQLSLLLYQFLLHWWKGVI